MLLKLNSLQYWKERGIEEHAFPHSFDLGEPVVRFDELARSMGVAAARVETPDQVGPAIAQALEHNGPFLIDLVVTNHVPGSKLGCKCGQ
jgi:benzoylformate decarboxylase